MGREFTCWHPPFSCLSLNRVHPQSVNPLPFWLVSPGTLQRARLRASWCSASSGSRNRKRGQDFRGQPQQQDCMGPHGTGHCGRTAQGWLTGEAERMRQAEAPPVIGDLMCSWELHVTVHCVWLLNPLQGFHCCPPCFPTSVTRSQSWLQGGD